MSNIRLIYSCQSSGIGLIICNEIYNDHNQFLYNIFSCIGKFAAKLVGG